MTEKLHLYYREHKCITKQRVRHKLRRLTQIGFDIYPINNQTIWVNRIICGKSVYSGCIITFTVVLQKNSPQITQTCGEIISRKRKMRSA